MQGSGDVKYHLGTSADRDFDGNTIHLSPGPPTRRTLELVDPVVIGKVRAKQVQRGDTQGTKFLLLLHGDAAFAGQGIIPETLMMSELPGYKSGRDDAHRHQQPDRLYNDAEIWTLRSLLHGCRENALRADLPRSNGDDPEAVVHVARIATEYRQESGRDVVIDMFCYRRFGHNEGDS